MKYITFYWILTFTLPLLNRKENMVSTVFLEQELCIFLFRVIDEGLKGCIKQQDSQKSRLQEGTRATKIRNSPFFNCPLHHNPCHTGARFPKVMSSTLCRETLKSTFQPNLAQE